MLTSFWPILTAIFIISALLKLVYKLIKEEKAPSRFGPIDQRVVGLQEQQQQHQVQNADLPAQLAGNVVAGEQSLEEEEDSGSDLEPGDQQEEELVGSSHRRHQVALLSRDLDRHLTAGQFEGSRTQLADHYGPIWPPQSSISERQTTQERYISSERLQQQSSSQTTRAAHQQINRWSRCTDSNGRQQNAQQRQLVQFDNQLREVNFSSSNEISQFRRHKQTSKQIGALILFGAHSLFLIEPCKYIFQLLDGSIKLFWSFLDSIEGIETENTTTTLLNRWWLNSSNNSIRASEELERPKQGAAARRSNYFHRRYLSRRPLSAVLLEDLELEGDKASSESDSDCSDPRQPVDRRLEPIVELAQESSGSPSHRWRPIRSVASKAR